MTITVTSSLFAEGDTIPTSAAYEGAGGDNISPDLAWTGVPDRTASIALTCWDPDAPTTVGFTHWVLFNVDPSVTALAAGAGAAGRQPPGSILGITDWGENQYGGMYPPPGDPAHHYIFTVWALDEMLGLDEKTPYAKLRFMMGGHVLDQGTLTGRWALPS